MNCKQFKTILNAYLDNAVSRHEKQMVEQHISGCSGCAKEYSEFKNMKNILAGLQKHNAPANFESKVMGKIKKGVQDVNPLESFIATAKTTLIAAVFIFGVIATFSFFTPSISSVDNVDAINNYVLKGNAFAKQSKISDAKIMQEMLS